MIHTIDDIKRKYKEYLTKAQIRELAKRDLLYRQTHSAERAEALGTIRSEYDAGRRALQNMGLASRQGNLISGKEKAMRAPLERQYVDYSRDLHRIEHGYTERDAVNMANDNIRAAQAAARARAAAAARAREEAARQAAEQQRLRAEVNPRNKVVWNQRMTDSGTGDTSPAYTPAQHTQSENQAYGLKLAQQQGLGGVDAIKYAVDYANASKNKQSNPFAVDRTSRVTRDKVASAESRINELSKKIVANQAVINSAQSKPTSSRDSIGKMNNQKTEQARRNVAEAKSGIARTIASFSLPENVAELVTLSDKDFQIRYDAAKKSYEKALEYAKGLKSHQPKEANKRIKEATEAFTAFERANSVRNSTNTEALYAADVDIPASSRVKNKQYNSVPDFVWDNQKQWRSVDWARASEWDGSNWQNAYDRKWDADEYGKANDTKGSKYDPLVNEWAFINGRTAILYAQKFKLTQNLGNVKDIIESAFGGDVNRNHAYKWFVDNCVMTFNHDYETSGTKNQKKHMESMLTLANLMTDEERAKFNAILDRSGAKAADNYFEYLYNDILPDRFVGYVRGENEFDTRDTLGIIEQSALSVPINIAQGITGPINTLTSKPDEQVAAMLDAMKYNTAQNLRDTVSQRFGETGGFLYGTGMSIADSAVVALISQGIGSAIGGVLGETSTVALKSGKTIDIAQKAGSILGGAILGGSAFNSSYAEALQQGKTPDQAATLAVGNGLNEMIFESVSLDLLVSRFKVGDIVKVSKNNFVNAVVNTLIEGGVEGSEEVFTDLANKLWDDKISGIYSDELTKIREYMSDGMSYDQARAKVNSEFAGQLGMSFLGGAISGGIMGSGAHIANVINNRSFERYGKNVSKSETAVKELRNFDFADKEMSDLAKSKKLTYQDIAMLDLERTRQSIADSTAYIDKAVADGKMPQEVADIYKKAAENGFQYEENGEIVNPDGVTVDEALVMQKYSDVITNADLIRDGMKSVVDSLDAAQRTFDTELDNIYNDTQISEAERGERITAALAQHTQAVSKANEAVKNTVEMRDKETQERINALPKKQRAAAQAEYEAAKAKENESPLDIDSEARTVRTENGSVKFDFDGNNTAETMTQEQRDSLNFAKLFAEKYGLNIEIAQQFVGDQANKNGDYNPNTNTIRINLSGTNSVVYTVSHELTHWLKDHNEQAFSDLSNMIKEQLGRIDLVSSDLPEMYQNKMSKYMTGDRSVWDALIAYEKDRYAKNGIELNQESVEEEVVARCCESFLARESFMREMAKKHLKSARSIAQFLQKIRNDIASLQEAARSRNAEQNLVSDTSPEDTLMQQYTEIEQIAGLWTRGVNEAVQERKAAKAQSEAKAAIMEKNGYRYVQTSRNVITGNDSSKWGQQVTDYINNEIRHGKDVIVYTKKGVPLTITKDTAGKAAFRNYVQMKNGQRRLMTDAEYAVKLRAETHIDELAKVSDGKKTRSGGVFDEKGHVFAKDGFNYREAYFLDGDTYTGDNYYVVTMSVGKNGRIQTIYNVGKVEKTDLPTKWGQAPDRSKTETEDTVSKGSISSKTDSVNRSEQNKASISDREYLDLAKRYESGDKSVEADLRKAVDAAAKAAGYTKQGYHGTAAKFNVFNRTNAGAHGENLGPGYYFAADKTFAREYARASYVPSENTTRIIDTYLKIKKPASTEKVTITKEQWHDFLQYVIDHHSEYIDGAWQGNFTDESIFTFDQDWESEKNSYGNDKDLFLSFAHAYAARNAEVTEAAYRMLKDSTGYDGIIYEPFYKSTDNDNVYVVFTNTQIKQSDLITRDDNGNIIPLSERFNEKEEDIRRSIMDKEFRMTKQGAVRTFEQRDTTATVIGSSVELEGGSLLNRVRMMQNLAEEYGSVTVDAKSEKEAEAFKRAGAKKETDAFSGSEYGTWAFEHQENKYETDTQYDAKQKRQFANDVLKEIGTRKNFTRDELVRYRAALEKAFAVLHNSTYGKGDQLAAYEYAEKLFDRMLDSYAEMSEADADMRDTLLSDMTKAKTANGRTYRVLEVTAKQMAEIRNAYENARTYASELSKALGARVVVKETANAKTLEDIFTHSTDTRIDSEINEGDMPGELMRLAKETMAQRTNPYKAESEERQAVKDQMWDKAIELVGTEKTTAQKVREAIKETREAERKAAKDKTAKAVDEARLAERMHEGALRAKDRRVAAKREAELKRRTVEREANLKQQFRETTAKRQEEQLKRDMRKVALKWNQRLVKMLANPTEASHVPVQLAREVAALTKTVTEYLDNGTERGRINLDKVIKAYQQAFDDQATIAAAQKENPNYDPRGTVIDREMYDEQLVQMMNELNELISGKSFKNLSASEMYQFLNVIRGVAHTVYDANRMIGTSERKAIWQVGSQMVEQFENAPKIGRGLRTFLEESLDLRRIALAFSGSDENAEFVKLVDQLNRGAIEKERVAQTLAGMFDGLTQQYGDEISKWYGKKAEWIDTGIVKNGRKVEITKGMRVSLAMHVLNEGNMRHIEDGGVTIPNREMYAKGKLSDAYANGTLVRLSTEQINEIISHMTEAEKAYVAVAKEFFHQRTGYYVNRTSLQLLGYRKATVENYFPIHTDRNYTKSDFASVVRDGSIEGQGFLKERVMASNPVYLEDITSVVNRQIKGVSLYAGLAVPMRNFNAVMNASVYEDEDGKWVPRTTVRKTMQQSMGEYGTKVVQGFLQDVSGMSAVDVSPGERMIAKLQTRYVKAVLLANLKVTLKQAASYPTAAAVIPWKYLAKALAKGGRKGRIISRANVELINQYTPLYQMRRAGMANEITSIMAEKGLEQKMPWLLGWITSMDVATVGRLWSAAEYMVADQQKNLVVGSDAYYKAVAEVFNKTVQQTQPNFTPLQRNAALRSKNPVVRTLTLFGTQRMQNGGILIEAALELKNSKGKSKEAQMAARIKFGRAVASQIVQNFLLVAFGFAVDALRGRMKAWNDDDKELTVESVFTNVADQFMSNAIGSFLGGSELYGIISGLYKKIMDKTAYDTEFTVPALDALEEIVNFGQNNVVSFSKYMLSDKYTADEKQKKAIAFSKKLAKVAGYITGFPMENFVKDLIDGWIPAVQDIIDTVNTGEWTPYLHNSGKLDSAKTARNYKEWTKAGYSGKMYFYWENKMNDVSGGREGRIPLLKESDLTNEQKAKLMELFDTSGATSKGTVVYNKKGEIIIDFSNPDK